MSGNNCKTSDMNFIEALNKSPHKMFCSKGHNIYDEDDNCYWCGESKIRTKNEKKRFNLLCEAVDSYMIKKYKSIS